MGESQRERKRGLSSHLASQMPLVLPRYLHLMEACSEQQWKTIYEEVKGLSQLRFDFRDKPVRTGLKE